ncbi:YfkD family protein [Bacillus licheniformis]|nr:YfkD family protein [Bacillus licheniformis]
MKSFVFTLTAFYPLVFAVQEADAAKPIKIPSSVTNISKENTYPNASQDQPRLQPSELAEELLKTTDIAIEIRI